MLGSSIKSCILSLLTFNIQHHTSYRTYPSQFQLPPFDVPCWCNSSVFWFCWLLSLYESFSMFPTLHFFSDLTFQLFHSLLQGFPFLVLKISTLSFGFLYVWSFDIRFFTKTFTVTLWYTIHICTLYALVAILIWCCTVSVSSAQLT